MQRESSPTTVHSEARVVNGSSRYQGSAKIPRDLFHEFFTDEHRTSGSQFELVGIKPNTSFDAVRRVRPVQLDRPPAESLRRRPEALV